MWKLSRRGCLPVRASDCMSWKYEGEEECGCGGDSGVCFV